MANLAPVSLLVRPGGPAVTMLINPNEITAFATDPDTGVTVMADDDNSYIPVTATPQELQTLCEGYGFTTVGFTGAENFISDEPLGDVRIVANTVQALQVDSDGNAILALGGPKTAIKVNATPDEVSAALAAVGTYLVPVTVQGTPAAINPDRIVGIAVDGDGDTALRMRNTDRPLYLDESPADIVTAIQATGAPLANATELTTAAIAMTQGPGLSL